MSDETKPQTLVPWLAKAHPLLLILMCENNILDLWSMLFFPGTCTSILFAVSMNPSTSTLKDLWGPKETLLTRTECSGTGWGTDFNLVLTGAPHYSPALVSALSCLISATWWPSITTSDCALTVCWACAPNFWHIISLHPHDNPLREVWQICGPLSKTLGQMVWEFREFQSLVIRWHMPLVA